MGKIWEQKEEYDGAIYYYLQADYAIRMRMRELEYYGDSKVAAAISDALERTKAELGRFPERCARFYYLGGLFETALADLMQMLKN